MTTQLEEHNQNTFGQFPFFLKETMEAPEKTIYPDTTIQKAIGSICHDLRSPLATILGFIEVLQEEEDAKNLKEILICMERTAQRGINLTTELLELMSTDLNKKSLHFESYNFLKLFREAIAEVKPLADKKKIQIIREFKSYQNVKIDQKSMARVLNNLLTNAIKFSPYSSNITCYTNSKNSGLYVEISDSGIGIEKSRIPTLFDWHHRDFTTGTDGEVGHGWGLSICQEMIKAHGSEIKVQSIPNKGSRFYFLLPWDNSSLV